MLPELPEETIEELVETETRKSNLAVTVRPNIVVTSKSPVVKVTRVKACAEGRLSKPIRTSAISGRVDAFLTK